jgi:hypothetical protein
MIAGIAAVSSNGMIGMNGWLPWDIPEDVAYFEDMIVGAALIVGRRTYDTMAVVPPTPSWQSPAGCCAGAASAIGRGGISRRYRHRRRFFSSVAHL